jgi:hypothetical protein
MTHTPGDSFIVHRCNQCRAPHATWFRPTDEYLCEECEDFARTLVATQEAMERE